MPREKYSFQGQKRHHTRTLFKHGLNAASYILFALKEGGKGFLEELPSSYPGFKLMKMMFGVETYKKRGFNKETIRTNLYRLRKQGLIVKDPKQQVHYLTDKGEEFVTYIENRYLILKKPWDGKLRLVIFDIPEKKHYWRKSIRQELLLMQYQQLQKSVYVGKHSLPESFCKEIERAGLGKYIFIFIVDKVDRKEEMLKLLKEK